MMFTPGTPVRVYLNRRLFGSRVLIAVMGEVDMYGVHLYPRRDEVSLWVPFDAIRAIEVSDG